MQTLVFCRIARHRECNSSGHDAARQTHLPNTQHGTHDGTTDQAVVQHTASSKFERGGCCTCQAADMRWDLGSESDQCCIQEISIGIHT